MKLLEEELLNTEDAAVFLGCSINTLAVWRYQKIRLPYLKKRNRVLYRKLDLIKYLEEEENKIVYCSELK